MPNPQSHRITFQKVLRAMHVSLIIPAFNEAERINKTLTLTTNWFMRQPYAAEIIVVDDGSTDDTAGIVRKHQRHTPISLILESFPENRGKGAATRAGMLEKASGRFRFYYDADASTPIEEIERAMPLFTAGADIVIGSRALPDSLITKRQVWYRESMGRCYNIIEHMLRLTRFKDTQCGFKGFTAEATAVCFPRQTVDRFSFDAELLFIADKHKLRIAELPVRWNNSPTSKVNPITDSARMFWDLIKIRANSLSGRYD